MVSESSGRPGADPGLGIHPWEGEARFKIHHSIAFKHQFITGRPLLGKILYPPLEAMILIAPWIRPCNCKPP